MLCKAAQKFGGISRNYANSSSLTLVSKKINKFKELLSNKKKKAIEATTGKFVSNGSLLSQNGLRNSEAELQNKIGGGECIIYLHT